MKRIRIIPVLLIKGNGLYKTIRFKKPNYIGDPLNAVKIFNDKGADEIVILDIDASKENKEPNYNLVSKIAGECFMPMTYGGGISKLEQAKKIFSLGIEKIIINSAFNKNPKLVTDITEIYGSQSTVVSIDYKLRKGSPSVFTHGGTVNTGHHPVEYAKRAIDAGAGELLINCIEKEGTRSGYDLDVLKQIATAVNVPVIVCGGASGIEDMYKAVVLGKASAVAAGSMFVYIGKSIHSILINYPSEERLNNLYERI